MKSIRVAIIIGSENDNPIAEKVVEVLRRLGISYELQAISAHRAPKRLETYIESSQAEVFIAIAGLSAALPGFISSRTVKPVIGVPLSVKLGGLDALFSTVQMPAGVPVATVGIDNGENAAWLAARILALRDAELQKRLEGKSL